MWHETALKDGSRSCCQSSWHRSALKDGFCMGFSSSWHKRGLKDGSRAFCLRPRLLPIIKPLVDWTLTKCVLDTIKQIRLSRPICATNSKKPCKRGRARRQSCGMGGAGRLWDSTGTAAFLWARSSSSAALLAFWAALPNPRRHGAGGRVTSGRKTGGWYSAAQRPAAALFSRKKPPPGTAPSVCQKL